MIILGVSFLSDASACVLVDGELVAAVGEERLNGVKLWHGVPHRAIAEVLRLAGLRLADVDVIATHGRSAPAPDRAIYEQKAREIEAGRLDAATRDRQLAALWSRFDHETSVLSTRTPAYLAEIASLGVPVLTYEHHEAHAACAFFGSGWDAAAVITADGWGEDASHTLSLGSGLHLERISHSHTFDSLGYFYGSITAALGFTAQRHEGKVLGLAAHCTEPRSYPVLREMIGLDAERRRFIGRMETGLYIPRFSNPALADVVATFPREDVAAAAQRVLEELVCAHVESLGSEARRLALAGGVFANVRLNQRLAALPAVEEVFVYPNMGDGGLCVGAAWLAHAASAGARPAPLATCYLGTVIDDAAAATAIAEVGLEGRRSDDIAGDVAQLLAAGRVVARATGAMEFGPRALGHRSILFHARDAGVNRWLNAQLQRSEFMPFAPASLHDSADTLYLGLDASRRSTPWMTITVDCTAEMRQRYPAAVHVDGTARPQLVSPGLHPDLHAILSAYRGLTGESTLINTSFNMHEHPIVCTAADSVRAFLAGRLDALALGSYIVERPGARSNT